MAEILDGLTDYVPLKKFPDGSTLQIPRIIYGHQLMVARIRGAVTLRSSEEKQLKEFTEAVSDWHTRLCLVTVCTTEIIIIVVD